MSDSTRSHLHGRCPDGRQFMPQGGRNRGEPRQRYTSIAANGSALPHRTEEAERAAHVIAGPTVFVTNGKGQVTQLDRVPATRTNPSARGPRHCWGFNS